MTLIPGPSLLATDALKSTEDVPTVLGPFNFTDKRDANHPPVIQVVQDGGFAVLK